MGGGFLVFVLVYLSCSIETIQFSSLLTIYTSFSVFFKQYIRTIVSWILCTTMYLKTVKLGNKLQDLHNQLFMLLSIIELILCIIL